MARHSRVAQLVVGLAFTLSIGIESYGQPCTLADGAYAPCNQVQLYFDTYYFDDYGSSSTGVDRIHVTGGNKPKLPLSVFKFMAVDLPSQRLYYTASGGRLLSAELSGAGNHPVVGAGVGGGLAVESGTGKLIYSSSSPLEIRRVNPDGTGMETLFGVGASVGGIALDEAGGKIYWIERTHPTSAVYRANMDGSGEETILSGPLVVGLAVDDIIGKVYWLETEALRRADLDGANVELLASQATPDAATRQSLALDLAAGKVYWLSHTSVFRANLDGSDLEDLNIPLPFLHWHFSIALLPMDCDQNGVGDVAEMLGDPSLDLNGDNLLDQCEGRGPLLEGSSRILNRFIDLASVWPPAPGEQDFAIAVHLDSLLRPDSPPANTPDFSALEGQIRYLNSFRDGDDNPVLLCQDPASPGGTYACATLGCEPEYRDWRSVIASDFLRATGSAIIPSSQYSVRTLPLSCLGNEQNCLLASEPALLVSGPFGDAELDRTPGYVNIIDLGTMVDTLKSLPNTLSEGQALVREGAFDPRAVNASVIDLGTVVNAMKGFPYTALIGSCD